MRTLGHAPTAAVADGASGYAPNAPYDRVLATCSVPRIPLPWVTQTGSGGMILANLLPGFGGGLIRLTVAPDHSASGRFLPDPAYFMRMSGASPAQPRLSELIARSTGEGAARPIVLADDLGEESLWFLAGLAMPRVVRFGAPGTQSVFDAPRLVDLVDGSWARISRGDCPQRTVTQGGSRRLWDELESAHRRWLQLGKPARQRSGLTVTAASSQYVWLDACDSPHRWSLTA